jgi:hypothetical protein
VKVDVSLLASLRAAMIGVVAVLIYFTSSSTPRCSSSKARISRRRNFRISAP